MGVKLQTLKSGGKTAIGFESGGTDAIAPKLKGRSPLLGSPSRSSRLLSTDDAASAPLSLLIDGGGLGCRESTARGRGRD